MADDFDPDCYYQLQSGRVVEIVGELNGYLTLREVPAGQVFDVERSDFTANLHGGYIQPVELVWQPTTVDRPA